ncbi:DUF3883 domain-containing protein [uncultured Draconibacterium sp.]|uniref:DUF3883 domain-containing protein n=1 Tax=uncultured Draconibacterium sp. TaxID=1573823 RepID=UPI002AA774D5|nr:DUF3883 domain-containing protein [uncultured Draconibacterium sp.]
MPLIWSNTEVQLIVADYFNMLSAELKGEPYSKAAHRRALMPLLQNRSEGSVEFKHQNISAVLMELGQPYIVGYLPRSNYQHSLRSAVIKFLDLNPDLENQFEYFATKEIVTPITQIDFERFVAEPPASENVVSEPAFSYGKKPMKVNYIKKEQENQRLGYLGEEMIMEYERHYLNKMGKYRLAGQIEWISQKEGDGAGYDILSRNPDGSQKYIEVKTTKLSRETPIYFSRNELDFSVNHRNKFYLYRVFNFEKNARVFKRNGALNEICNPVPISYQGFF